MGGSDDPNNLVELSVEEHAEAHRVLYEKYGKIQDKLAWQGLAGMIEKQDLITALQSELNSGQKNNMYGRSAVKENNLRWYTNGKDTIYVTEGTQPEGFVRGRSGMKRPPHSQETKSKISESLTGNIPPNRISVVAPDGSIFPSIKSAAESLNITVSKFRWSVEKSKTLKGWTINYQ